MFHLLLSSCAVFTIEVLRHLQILAFTLNLLSHCHTVKRFRYRQDRSNGKIKTFVMFVFSSENRGICDNVELSKI